MEFDIPTLPVRDRHKLLSSVVLPRPIAWVTTMDGAGQINAAPFSFFNLMGSDPAIVVLGISRSNGLLKDTASNMMACGEFVIQLVTETLVEQMNQTGTEFPHGINELEIAGLATLPSLKVKPPRIAASPVHMECKYHSIVEIGNTSVLLGEVIYLHIDDAYVDATTLHVHANQLAVIGRMHGGGWYARTTDLFELGRVSYKQWQERG